MATINTLQSAGKVQCGKKNRMRLRLFLKSFLLEGLRISNKASAVPSFAGEHNADPPGAEWQCHRL